MKKILLILPFLFYFNSGFAQDNSSFDRSTDLQLALRSSATGNEFISAPLTLTSLPEAAFFTVAVFVEGQFTGQLAYQLAGKDWQSFNRYHEATDPNRTIFELLFVPNQSTTIRFKSDQDLPGDLSVRSLTLRASNQLHQPSGSIREDCNCPQPDICGRDCWCPAGDCPTDSTPFPTDPTHVIVHHSASASMSNDFPAVVRSYWDFHVNVNGWDDIGYNWLVDGEGVIYEGRGSGNQGAHFSCMNNETTGICMIGNFENSTPTPTALAALVDLIAWEVCDKNIVPQDSSNHITSGSLLAHISGHRDGNDLPNSCTNTVCPGENLYPLLPDIRDSVSDKACLNDLVSTQEIELSSFNIFPNPSNGQFKISGDLNQIASLHVFSQTGQLHPFTFDSNGILELKNTGLFILKIIQKNGSITTKKLIIHPNY